MRFLASYVILLALKLNVMFYATFFAIKNATLTHFDRECSIGNRFRLLSKFFERETLYKNHTK